LALGEPPSPTLGTIQQMAKLSQEAEGKAGMALVRAKLSELNFRYCWTPGLRNKPRTNWGQVNRHIWRMAALYDGGDCFLADWPGAVPNQRLWPSKALGPDGLCTLPGYRWPT
jgi:hypothetical protein